MIPNRYWNEIQALQSNDFASLEKYRLFRHFEDNLKEFLQIVVALGPEAKNQARKMVNENVNILESKQCDETATENKANKRKKILMTILKVTKRDFVKTQRIKNEMNMLN